MVTNRVKGKII